MIFPLYTHVHVPAGIPAWSAKWADKLDGKGKPVVDVDINIVKESFDGVVVKVSDESESWFRVELRPTGNHTKIENPETEETFIFLDSTIENKITRL